MKVTIQSRNEKFVIAIETFRYSRREFELRAIQEGKPDRKHGPVKRH